MILAALTVAAILTGTTPAPATPPSASNELLPTPNLYRRPANCGDLHRQVIERQREELKKLGQLPNGVAQYAVERSVGGCGVPTPVGYHPGYLLPGAADAPPVSAPAPKP